MYIYIPYIFIYSIYVYVQQYIYITYNIFTYIQMISRNTHTYIWITYIHSIFLPASETSSPTMCNHSKVKEFPKPSYNLQRGKLASNLHTMQFVPWVLAPLSFQSGVGQWLWASEQCFRQPLPQHFVRCQHRDVW